MTIDNSTSRVDLAALFGKSKPKKPQDKDQPASQPLQDGEYEYEWGKGPWLSLLNDALFQGDE